MAGAEPAAEIAARIGRLHAERDAAQVGAAAEHDEHVLMALLHAVVHVHEDTRHGAGQFAADVRGMKKPEPYKGKGIHYKGEYIIRKQGKKGV